MEGNGVHIITVNDHLAKRDAEWMKPIYEFLGITVGYLINDLNHEERHEAYRKCVTYGTNNEFGFDYLRDNMVVDIKEKVQRGHHFCIIDEVDSILIDEARTPLIISGPSESNIDKYYEIDKIIPRLKEGEKDEKGVEIAGTGDYIIDLKDKNLILTEEGVKTVEKLLQIDNLYDVQNVDTLHHVNQALKAHKTFEKDKDYIVEEGEVHIIDEFTGRKMAGRRFSDGLHQAIEAKERVNIQLENQTLASITLQNYFRMYATMSGMTGTADTEAQEFHKIYKLDVIVIPTNKPITRVDRKDIIYRTEKEKFNAIVEKVKEVNDKGQPILIGTASVEKSEQLSKLFKKNNLPHELLNAKNHEREASIVEKAGQNKAITIATNMAGRGTDIKLGENIEEMGGLLIVGSERHESRRIDNQLRGRCGRQGDKGESIFFISLEDELMRRFNSDRISGVMQKLGMSEGEKLESGLLSNMIENAQKKVEGHNFDIRKYLIEYDDVMNVQRKYIYEMRDQYLQDEDHLNVILEYLEELTIDQLEIFSEDKKTLTPEIYSSIVSWLSSLGLKENFEEDFSEENTINQNYNEFEKELIEFLTNAYRDKRAEHAEEILNPVEKYLLLNTIDQKWKEHLFTMDHLRQGINLRSYGERRPLVEFKNEGFRVFKQMIFSFKAEVLEKLFRIQAVKEERTNVTYSNERQQGREASQSNIFNLNNSPQNQNSQGQGNQAPKQTPYVNYDKIGRNDLCPCGSGKKYKHCCLLKKS